MKIIKDINPAALKAAASALKRGAVVVYPTDTAYALGCDATNAKAVRSIFRIKGRSASKGLPIIVADDKMAEKYFELDSRFRGNDEESLAARYWPGPFSIILKAKKGIAKKVLEKGTAAVRVPASEISRELARLVGRPLTATSANISGKPACYSVIAFMRQFAADPFPALRQTAIALDAGSLPRRRPSTIVRVGKSGIIEVLRKGPINIFRA